MKKLILVRHASTIPLESGDIDTRDYNEILSEKGRQQAEALAARLADVPVDAVYSSPQPRALATAYAISAGRPVLKDSRLEDRKPQEALDEVYSRLLQSVHAMAGTNVVVVTHGTPIALILCRHINAPPNWEGSWGITPASISVVQDGVVVAVNDTSHLGIRAERAEYDPHTWTYILEDAG